MFLDNTEYPFAAELEKGFPDIRREFEALAPDDFVAWPVMGRLVQWKRWIPPPGVLAEEQVLFGSLRLGRFE